MCESRRLLSKRSPTQRRTDCVIPCMRCSRIGVSKLFYKGMTVNVLGLWAVWTFSFATLVQKPPCTRHNLARLCSSKTLFIKTGGRMDLACHSVVCHSSLIPILWQATLIYGETIMTFVTLGGDWWMERQLLGLFSFSLAADYAAMFTLWKFIILCTYNVYTFLCDIILQC